MAASRRLPCLVHHQGIQAEVIPVAVPEVDRPVEVAIPVVVPEGGRPVELALAAEAGRIPVAPAMAVEDSEAVAGLPVAPQEGRLVAMAATRLISGVIDPSFLQCLPLALQGSVT